jgi:hypothetical protein
LPQPQRGDNEFNDKEDINNLKSPIYVWKSERNFEAKAIKGTQLKLYRSWY